MSSRPPSLPAPRDAATVVVFRRDPAGGAPQLLMLERAAHMRFAASAAVFPGGAVDEADRILAAHHTQRDEDLVETAARIAGIRETLEEAGLLLGVKQSVTGTAVSEARAELHKSGALGPVLDQFGWSLDLSELVPFARWCPNFARAFDTWFYLADLGTGDVAIEADGTENSHMYWSSARDTLAMAERGEVSVLFPTLMNLKRLALFDDFADARADAATWPIDTIRPWVEHRDGVDFLTIPQGLGFPVTALPHASVRQA